jgi:hypothetical protein
MHEGIVAAAFGRNEAEALVGIEEFYSSGDHMGILCPMYDGHTPTAAHPGFVRLERDKGEARLPDIRRMRRKPR